MAGTETKENKDKAKRDPESAPAKQLLGAIINALEAGVPTSEIIPSLKFAHAATGYKAPIWRASRDALDAAAAAQRNGQTPVVTQPPVEVRGSDA